MANENFPLFSIKLLRKAGHKTASVIEETPRAKDLDILKRAQKENLVILTFDRDYGDLVFREGLLPPPAILFFRQEPYPPDRPADLVLAMLSVPQQAEGCMVVISERNIRRKHFPTNG